MAAASSSLSSSSSIPHLPSSIPHRHLPFSTPLLRSPLSPRPFQSLTLITPPRLRLDPLPSLSNGAGDNGEDHSDASNNSGEDHSIDGSGNDHNNNNNNGGNGGNNNNDGNDGEEEEEWKEDRNEALIVLSSLGRSLDSLPMDLAEAVRDGRITGEIITRFVNLEKSPLLRWLMAFGGFRERLLADDLFLAKILMECGVGVFTKTAAELSKRKENFFKELDFVISDIIMAVVADFMLVWLPAPTVSLRSSVSLGGGPLAKIFQGCPDNAFQVALAGRSYTLLQRIGALVRNGAKLFVVGTGASVIGTAVSKGLIKARKAVNKENAHEGEALSFSTCYGYGVYMAISSNLRYAILAGVIEQRILEPLLHNNKALLSATCFAARTGNTFIGSLLWIDCARWLGIQ